MPTNAHLTTNLLPAIMHDLAPGVRAANLASARRIAARAEASAPRLSGDLAESVRAESGPGTDARAVVGDWKAHLIEFGTVRHAAQPFLVPAAEAERDAHARAIRALFS